MCEYVISRSLPKLSVFSLLGLESFLVYWVIFLSIQILSFPSSLPSQAFSWLYLTSSISFPPDFFLFVVTK